MRRVSHMSIEDSASPASDSDSILTESDVEHYSQGFQDKKLRPQLSHTSSTGAIGGVVPTLLRTRTNKSTATNATTTDPAFEVDFEDGERANPQNFPTWYKAMIIFVMSYGTTCVALYSTSYTSAIPGIKAEFGISNNVGILGVTTYMFGIAAGAVTLAPLSEMFGRRPVYIVAFFLFVIFVIPCALATNIETILITRFFGAFCAAAMISNAPGTVNDIVDDQHRALAFSIWSIGPMNGPVIGPVVGGFVYQYMGWRWVSKACAMRTAVLRAFADLLMDKLGCGHCSRRGLDHGQHGRGDLLARHITKASGEKTERDWRRPLVESVR